LNSSEGFVIVFQFLCQEVKQLKKIGVEHRNFVDDKDATVHPALQHLFLLLNCGEQSLRTTRA
jgi:hypothetical protein